MVENISREELHDFRMLCEKAVSGISEALENPAFSFQQPEDADPETLQRLRRQCRRLPAAFTGRDTALSAGCTPFPSLSYVLPVARPFLPPGKVYRCGSLPQKRDTSFLQLILLTPSSGAPSFNALLAKRSLTGILPGYMAKSLGRGTSVKIHREVMKHGFSEAVLEAMIREVYLPSAAEAAGLRVITGFDCDREIAALEPVLRPVDEALNRFFRERVRRGYEDCGLDADCSSCDENVICRDFRRLSREMER